MFRLVFVICLFCAVSLNNLLLCAEDAPSTIKKNKKKSLQEDTLDIKKMPLVEVTSTRIFSNSAINYTPNYTINKADINKLAPLQVSEVLNLTPGVNITDYGGLGAIKTVSLRGSGSSRTLLLIDGMPISSSQNSSFDLSGVPVGILNNIEIVRGGASAIFGGNAIGGAVNLRTDIIPNQVANFTLSAGSFGEISTSASGGAKIGEIFSSLNVNYTKTDGDFDFIYNEFGVNKSVRRINSDYRDFNVSMSVSTVRENWKHWARILLTNTNKGVPGAVLQGTLDESSDRSKDNRLIFLANTSYIFKSNSMLNFSAIAKLDNNKYIEPNLQKESNFNLQDYGINIKYDFTKYELNCELLTSLYHSILNGNMLDLAVGSKVSRSTLGLAFRLEKNISNLDITSSIRLDYINNLTTSNTQVALSALGGLVYSFEQTPVKLKTSCSRNFRSPNFNEMYYRNYGTRDLRPETSNNFNFGFSSVILKYLTIEADFFAIYTKDMIMSIPKSPISWRAENIDNAFSRGIEFSSNLVNQIKIIKNLSIADILFSYTLQKTTDKSNKQLVFTPQELISSNINIELYNFFLGMKIDYSSFRYLQTDNDENSILPSYTVAHLYIYKNINFSDLCFNLRLDCSNLFDRRFEMVPNYPMPGRSFRASLSVTIN